MGKKANAVLFSLLLLMMGGYVVYDQGFLSTLFPEVPVPPTGVQHSWFMNGSSFEFDGSVPINDTLTEIEVLEGEVVYIDFRAVLNAYNELGSGSFQFYILFDGVYHGHAQFLYTVEAISGHQLIAASFQYINSTMSPGSHTVQIKVSEMFVDTPSVRTYSLLVQTLIP